jgi:arsenate reductase
MPLMPTFITTDLPCVTDAAKQGLIPCSSHARNMILAGPLQTHLILKHVYDNFRFVDNSRHIEEIMEPRRFNVLFVCTGNSARSIIAEAILARLGAGRFAAFSAGSHPKGTINPFTLGLLKRMNHDVSGLRSKSWDEFSGPGAPELDFVFTVCDTAAGETCPYWPGQPMTAHWGLPDPASIDGSEAEKSLAFADAYRMLNHRIGIFVSLPLASLDRISLQGRLDQIGKEQG